MLLASPAENNSQLSVVKIKNMLGWARGSVAVAPANGRGRLVLRLQFSHLEIKEHFALSERGHGTGLEYRLHMDNVGWPAFWLYRVAARRRIHDLKRNVEDWEVGT